MWHFVALGLITVMSRLKATSNGEAARKEEKFGGVPGGTVFMLCRANRATCGISQGCCRLIAPQKIVTTKRTQKSGANGFKRSVFIYGVPGDSLVNESFCQWGGI